jgi:glucose-6-phosphate 1-dehydrogenase
MPGTIEDIPVSGPGTPARQAEPFFLVVFGASGDLTSRKLLPAIYNLHCQGLLHDKSRVIGFARTEMTDDGFRDALRKATREALRCDGRGVDDAGWRLFASRLHYVRGDYGEAEGFQALRSRIAELSAGNGAAPPNTLWYLATPPQAFPAVVEQLDAAGLARKGATGAPWSRLVVEKPFGRDLASARELNRRIGQAFAEEQVFRIDHYLGKETVQNILVLRFANSIFEPIWNHKYVHHVQITAAEADGVARRGRYYDSAGAIRDMVQNHTMHLLCLVAMEPPFALEAGAVRDEKVQVLRALRPIPPQCAPENVVLGQYAPGKADGLDVPGYLQESDVSPDSRTETFAALRVMIDNWRWAGVPFFIRTGKHLPARRTEISVHFRSVPQVLFNAPPHGPLTPNVLAMRIQPDEGIHMEFQVKKPGLAMQIRPLEMSFSYAEGFGAAPPEAYQRLLLDAALGDATLFTRGDEVDAAWQFLTPVLEGCSQCRGPLPQYPAGTWGPQQAQRLLAAEGDRWHVR